MECSHFGEEGMNLFNCKLTQRFFVKNMKSIKKVTKNNVHIYSV